MYVAFLIYGLDTDDTFFFVSVTVMQLRIRFGSLNTKSKKTNYVETNEVIIILPEHKIVE